MNDRATRGMFFWELSDDLPFSENDSLLNTVNNTPYLNGKRIGLYWTDWSIYSNTRAIASKVKQLSDFSDMLKNLSRNHEVILYYAFLETVQDKSLSDQLGTIYFADPWSDLSPENCSDDMLSDSYALKLKNKSEGVDKYKCTNASKFNNIGTLASLTSVTSVLSVGGAGHDKTFEILFSVNGGLNSYADNFVNSAKIIMKKYGVKGFDLDYENRNMSIQDEESYIKLFKNLRDTLGKDAVITVTVLQNQDYLSQNFANIAQLNSFVNGINVMTYDNHGSFDFEEGGTKVTGYNSNLQRNKYAPKYSVNDSITALLKLGVDESKLSFGAPLYVRSLANIHEGDSYGLGQGLIPGKELVIPMGDKDTRGCDEKNSCTGMYTYRYYVNNLENSSATNKTYDYSDAASTVTYIDYLQKPVSLNYNLEVTNLGDKTGITVYVGGGFSSNYLAPMVDQTYNSDTAVGTQLIEGKKNLDVTWQSWNSSGNCGQMDFTSNKHIMVNPETNKCDIK